MNRDGCRNQRHHLDIADPTLPNNLSGLSHANNSHTRASNPMYSHTYVWTVSPRQGVPGALARMSTFIGT